MSATIIEIAAPACLALGVFQLDGGPCLLSITLRHPPVQLLARPAQGLLVTGARADLAHLQATRFYAYHGIAPGAEIEIELAIPSLMGLGSGALLGLATARALATLHGLPASPAELARAVGLTPHEALALHGFAGGGLLAVDHSGKLLHRRMTPHNDERRDWVFVLVLPRVAPDTPAGLEERRLAALWRATLPESEKLFTDSLWPAIERDDIGAFAAALEKLQLFNHTSLAQHGEYVELSAEEQATLAVMRDNGALFCGRAPAGLALYALVEGGGPSRVMRAALTRHLGYMGGIVMASICDTTGARP